MEIKHVDSILVLGTSLRTNLANMLENVGSKAEVLMQRVAELGVNPTGAQVWEYKGCDGDVEKEFDLLISIPVDRKADDGNGFTFTELAPIKCASMIHKGAWSELGTSYCVLMKELEQQNLVFTGTSREIYLNCDFENPQNCITEIQVEIT